MNARIDKWLWAVRIFKTRTLAAEACRAHKVTIGGEPVKPAREVKIGDVIKVEVSEITKTVKVLGSLDRRVGAAVVSLYLEDQTDPAAYVKVREKILLTPYLRPKGAGRPVKREPRKMEEFRERNSDGAEGATF